MLTGFCVELAKNLLCPGETTQLLISFNPTFKTYPVIPCTEEDEVFLEVKHGAKIPIRIRAKVCTPQISYDKELVDFDSIICGDCLRKSILLQNE